ncbi:MAG: type II toxin-antitoxin system RelB/DinJ family antitoxin [Chloroflexi bacterium]|nr:type II toxin-antitoxin system RelB/DinJ family antitoxin [Chloroflexota bacterium]
MSHSDMIQVRVDPVLKEQVEDIFEELGLSTSQAITLFYQQVKENHGLPFEADIPNAITRQTFEDTDAGRNLVHADDEDDLFKRLGI